MPITVNIAVQPSQTPPALEAFLEKLLRHRPSSAGVDFPFVCELWREITRADWVWLWLHNHLPDKWELVAFSPVGDPKLIPEKLTAESSCAVTELCCRSGQPRFINDIAGFSEEFEGTRFRVVSAAELQRMDCKAFYCTPVSLPPPDLSPPGGSQFKPLRMAICAHYKRPDERPKFDPHVLLLMGRLTARFIASSNMAEQHSILLELNAMALPHLSKVSRRPLVNRKEYLDKLIELIKRRLHVRSVSIFYRDQTGDGVECLATTGLFRQNGIEVSQDDLSTVTYRRGEGITGHCFATGQPKIALVGERSDRVRPAKFREEAREIEEKFAWITYPIPSPKKAALDEKVESLGIIRCCDHTTPLLQNRQRNFEPVEVEALDFIARQSALVLETLATSVQRELTVGIVRHDLEAPVRMIEDTVSSLLHGVKEENASYELKNLGTTVLIIRNLVKQLDPDPTEIRDFEPQPTLLEGHILARLKAMLRHYAKEENDMNIAFDDFRKIPELRIDRVLIDRVLCNLIINAIKYGTRGTEIKVMNLTTKDSFVVAVANYGIGVTPEEEPYIFKSNYRSPRARRKKHGLGYGLKISKGAMQRHGGDLVLSNASEPTIFSMIFPRSLAVGGTAQFGKLPQSHI